jgi:hypothetical protein
MKKKKNKNAQSAMAPQKLLTMKFHDPVSPLGAGGCNESFSTWLERRTKVLVDKIDVVSVPEKTAKNKAKFIDYMMKRFKKGC